MRRGEIAAQLLMVCESGDPEVVNAEYGFPGHRYNYLDLADRFVAAVPEIFMNLEYVEHDAKEIQAFLYDVGKRHFGVQKDELNLWFKCMYCIYFGYENGPRLGEFVYIYGTENFLNDLERHCENPLRF